MKTLQRVLIMAGGTGGHVFPGLAVAKYLREKQIEVHWLGTKAGLEAKLVPEEHIPLHIIKINGVRGKNKLTFLLAPFKIAGAVWQSIKVMRRLKPDVVIGMGGFVSGPGGVAAWLLGVPLIIHEQNAIAGTTNKILAHFAKKILLGFPTAFKSGPKVKWVGSPVREELESMLAPNLRLTDHQGSMRLLVLGGSLGAKALNELVPKAIASLPTDARPAIIHQAGEQTFFETKNDYQSRGIEADVRPFIKEMGQVYSWADMVICRAGALTVSEICVVGLGALFVPFPFAIDDHQTANARYLVSQGAAQCMQQKDLTEAQLAGIVREFMINPKKRLDMALKAYRLRKIHVVDEIYQICQEVCH